jgi:hypothetical protein
MALAAACKFNSAIMNTHNPYTLNTLIFAKVPARALGISMIGSIFSSKRSDLT